MDNSLGSTAWFRWKGHDIDCERVLLTFRREVPPECMCAVLTSREAEALRGFSIGNRYRLLLGDKIGEVL
jgi:hypothetical protein